MAVMELIKISTFGLSENWHKYNLQEERQANMANDRTQSPALGGDIKGPAPSGAASQPMEVTPRMPKIHFGIFSRTTKDKYGWMTELLKSETFKDSVADVCDIYISNAFLQFTEKVSQSQCRFAILYHTKNHGRINITDVTDSLYDKELRYLSDTLGKKNVIVVVDDLEDSSSEEKRRILQNQPSILRLAQEMFLFSEREKTLCKRNMIQSGPSGSDGDDTLPGKLKSIERLLARAKSPQYNFDEERQANMANDRTQSPALGDDIKGPAHSGAAPQPMEVTPSRCQEVSTM
ncbi:hypothetical protein FKM82_030893 [Ascaphus truei]